MATKKVAARKKTEIEEEPLRDYEMVIIVNPEVADENLDGVIDSISKVITGKDGTVSEVDRWGKRKMAYPIKQFTEGSYVLARFKFRPSLSKELEADLQISDQVLRHLLIRLT
jgi:small subunit ribosomal protein S6